MEIKSICYEIESDMGNYAKEVIKFGIELEPDEGIVDAIKKCRNLAALCGSQNLYDLNTKIRDKVYDIETLEKKLTKARQDWESVSSFLRAQGINNDPPSLPSVLGVLQPASSPINGELEDEDENEDDEE